MRVYDKIADATAENVTDVHVDIPDTFSDIEAIKALTEKLHLIVHLVPEGSIKRVFKHDRGAIQNGQ